MLPGEQPERVQEVTSPEMGRGLSMLLSEPGGRERARSNLDMKKLTFLRPLVDPVPL